MGDAPPAYTQQAGYPPPKEEYPPPPQGGYYPPPPPQQPGYPPQPQGGYPPPPQPTTTVIVQPVAVQNVIYSHLPQNIVCPQCHANVVTATYAVNGTLTWLLCISMFCLGFWLCCWIPCVIDACKDFVHTCPNCKKVVGTFTRVGEGTRMAQQITTVNNQQRQQNVNSYVGPY